MKLSFGNLLFAASSLTAVNAFSIQRLSSVSTSTTSLDARRPILAGNWKLNPKSRDEALALLNGLSPSPSDVDVLIFPPLPYLGDVLKALPAGVQVGAQTCSNYEEGAFTGEVAPSMLASMNVGYVLLGHSERRTLFGETDSDINARVLTCLKEPNLKVVLCVGETLDEYEAGLLNSIVDTQTRKGLSGVSAQDLINGRVVIAYEPVWAIGTGLTATPEQAQNAHTVIRNTLAAMYPSTAVAESVRIQYGGSVKPESIADLMSQPDIDGALVGGASLDAASFNAIVGGASTGAAPVAAAAPVSYAVPAPTVPSSFPSYGGMPRVVEKYVPPAPRM
ncbi:triose phosphate isomerase [Chaetoceros tenuissimus]|uniref:Triosephosphate isomerase n=1 Tax=Chaetoceros tenuissimus TaxID=426638 RepID=A0AAD3HF67_9STRA|nr:triose phosphate isomerase [Chaetoceros tenuissimus]